MFSIVFLKAHMTDKLKKIEEHWSTLQKIEEHWSTLIIDDRYTDTDTPKGYEIMSEAIQKGYHPSPETYYILVCHDGSYWTPYMARTVFRALTLKGYDSNAYISKLERYLPPTNMKDIYEMINRSRL